MANLAEGQLGNIGSYSVVIQEGKLVVSAQVDLLKEISNIEAGTGPMLDVVLELLKKVVEKL